MAELRRDPVIGEWVVVASEKESLTPVGYEKPKKVFTQKAVCAFCEGREMHTPPEVDAVRQEGSQPDQPGWSVRAVPNRFPALKIEGDLDKRAEGVYDKSNGIGAHEVVIETPNHHHDLMDISVEQVADVLRIFQRRGLSLAKDKRFKYIMVFKNYGESAGASIEHAHSQIIALPMVPKRVLAEIQGAAEYHKFRGRCLFCDILEQEKRDKDRIVVENERFLAFCPFVPRQAFEIWIFSKEHQSDFFALKKEDDLIALAAVLRESLARLKKCLGCSYNFFIHTAPVGFKDKEEYHWHIEIVPQLVRMKGYEWGTGLYQVHTSPTIAAAYLRDVEL